MAGSITRPDFACRDAGVLVTVNPDRRCSLEDKRANSCKPRHGRKPSPRGDPAHCRIGPGGLRARPGVARASLDDPKPPIDRFHNLYFGAGG
jgi:hypothetical protein